MKKLILLSFLISSQIACTQAEETPVSPEIDMAKYDSLYQDRFKAYVEGYQAGLNRYDPLKEVSGFNIFHGLAGW